MISAAVWLSGCATVQSLDLFAAQQSPALAYWSSVVEADAGQRRDLLRQAQRDPSGWKLAMLQSLPAERDDTEAAQKNLRAVLKRDLSADEAALARLRLSELRRDASCSAENAELKDKLGKIVNLEQQIDNEH